MSALTAYLRGAQAQQQAQAQAQSNPPQPTESQMGDPSWAVAMSERQQLAFRSLSDAAVDHRYGSRQKSEMVRAALHGPTSTEPYTASSSFPGDIIESQIQSQSSPHMSNVSAAGKASSLSVASMDG